MVATGKQSCSRRRTESRRVKAVVLQAVSRQSLGGRRRAGPTERARSRETDVVEQNYQYVRGADWRAQRFNRRKRRVRVLGVERKRPFERHVGDRQDVPWSLVSHSAPPRLGKRYWRW